jgi:hypothetical protein
MQIGTVDVPSDRLVQRCEDTHFGLLADRWRLTNMASHIHYERVPSVGTRRGPSRHATASYADRPAQCSISQCTCRRPVSAVSVKN